VQFAETDAAGMVHFSVFFRYMEEAEHAVWRKAGLDILHSGPPSQSFGETGSLSWPRISAHCDFKSPLTFQDEFEVRTEIAAVTRSTIQWSHVLMRGETVIGSGTVTAICVKKLPDGGMKSTELPEGIISRLRAALVS
jgi:acyl-CoA thioester hydrolase